MSALVIGVDPTRLILNLETVSDFYGYFERSDDFVTGATLSLVFSDGSSFAATISGNTATFDEQVPEGGWTIPNDSDVSLVYSEPDGSDTYTQTIAKGAVKIR